MPVPDPGLVPNPPTPGRHSGTCSGDQAHRPGDAGRGEDRSGSGLAERCSLAVSVMGGWERGERERGSGGPALPRIDNWPSLAAERASPTWKSYCCCPPVQPLVHPPSTPTLSSCSILLFLPAEDSVLLLLPCCLRVLSVLLYTPRLDLPGLSTHLRLSPPDTALLRY